MPSSKLTCRRGVPVRPHVCHPPPPPPPPTPPPPAVESWMTPETQTVYQYDTARGDIYVYDPELPDGELFEIAWGYHHDWAPEPDSIKNGQVTDWGCTTGGDLGTYPLTAAITGPGLAPQFLEVEITVEEYGGGPAGNP